ncbi:MAG: hypothetical protein HY342_02050 [Candidatus Lambdaproteobacteria bacterium]|nr:hypothetical protein [Candidatus Lambdaproteobacteria bacterium]
MAGDYPYELLEHPQELAAFGEWSEEVYRDFQACQLGRMSEAQFIAKHQARKAILVLDMTGFTEAAQKFGELASLLRIYDVQKVCAPIFRQHRAALIHAFADDLTVIFDDPGTALDVAFEVHHRIDVFNRSSLASAHPARCCIGIGYGDIFAIGPNLAMGDEMNMASKLGEDTARGGETLTTANVYKALRHRGDCTFQAQSSDDLIFPYYTVQRNR